MKSKVVLIYPPTGTITDYNTPTGTLYVATYLEQNGYNVKFIDCSVDGDWHKKVLTEVKDAICFGSYCMSIHIKHLVPLLEEIKAANPNIKTVLGGAHPTIFPEQTAADLLVDFVVRGKAKPQCWNWYNSSKKGRQISQTLKEYHSRTSQESYTVPPIVNSWIWKHYRS